MATERRTGVEALTDGTMAAVWEWVDGRIPQGVEVFDVHRPGEELVDRREVDPVCGMTIDPANPAARLQFDGRDLMFCSQRCLQRFVSHTEQYV